MYEMVRDDIECLEILINEHENISKNRLPLSYLYIKKQY